jgi:anti-sigma regulatory factor (Ser/Thr protein kinase)
MSGTYAAKRRRLNGPHLDRLPLQPAAQRRRTLRTGRGVGHGIALRHLMSEEGWRMAAQPDVYAAAKRMVGGSNFFTLIVSRLERLLHIHSLAFPAKADRVREARRYVAATLGTKHPLRDDAIETVSELVTNAIRYGSRDEHAIVNLRIRRLRRQRVLLTVIDEGGTDDVPTIKRPDEDSQTGRGLLAVSALASRLHWIRKGSGHKVEALLDPLHPGPNLAEQATSVEPDPFKVRQSALDRWRLFRLRRRFPDWHIRFGDAQAKWTATRKRQLEEPRGNQLNEVFADDYAILRRALAYQESVDATAGTGGTV